MVLNRIREREKSIAIFGSDSDRSFLWIACAMCHQRFHLEPFFAFSFGPCPHIYSVVNTIHLQSVLYFPPFHFTFFCLLFISYVFFASFSDKSQNAPSSRSICQWDIQYVHFIIRDSQKQSPKWSLLLWLIVVQSWFKRSLVKFGYKILGFNVKVNAIYNVLLLHSHRRIRHVNNQVILLKLFIQYWSTIPYLEKQRKRSWLGEMSADPLWLVKVAASSLLTPTADSDAGEQRAVNCRVEGPQDCWYRAIASTFGANSADSETDWLASTFLALPSQDQGQGCN